MDAIHRLWFCPDYFLSVHSGTGNIEFEVDVTPQFIVILRYK